MLKSEIDKIPTKWRDLFHIFIDSYPEHWDSIEIFLKKMKIKMKRLPIYPKKKTFLDVFIILILWTQR